MMRQLQSGRKGAAKGQVRSVVIFIHGYGADGNDLLGLADPLAPHLKSTAFYAPDGPERCHASAMGRQWFPIPWIDGSTEEQQRDGIAQASDDLNAFIDQVMAEEGVAPQDVALVGFSQGSMMSMHIAPRRDQPLAAVVAISGRLMVPELLAQEAKVKPPILLVHGDQDPVVPFEDMSKAGDALVAAGFETYGHVMKGTGHGIAPDGLQVTLQFLAQHLPK